MLYGVEVPDEGGDTWFANMFAAYDALPTSIKARIADKRVIVSRVQSRPYNYPEFKRAHPNGSTYSIVSNSCSSNVADVLESIGILAHDPRWFPTPVTPAELDAVVEKSKRLATKNYYPKQADQ
jgi:hypothetical protein